MATYYMLHLTYCIGLHTGDVKTYSNISDKFLLKIGMRCCQI